MHPVKEVTSFDLLAVLVAAGFAVGIAPRSHRTRSRLGCRHAPLANGPYLIGTQLLRKPHGSAPSCRTVCRTGGEGGGATEAV